MTEPEHPRDTGLRNPLDGLSDRRREAARRLLERAGADRIRPRPDPAMPSRLSSGQEQIWLTDLMTGQPGSLTDHIALRLRGRLDLTALRTGVTGLIRRHDVLRTRLVLQHGVALQTVEAEVTPDLLVVDVPRGQVGACLETAARDLAQPFSLTEAPLLRTRVYRLDEDDHVVVFGMHHLITDGVSQDLFLRELEARYLAAVTEGEPAELPRPTVQYADWAIWQRGVLDGSRREVLLDYWTERLAGAPYLLSLPLDHPRPNRRGGAFLDSVAPPGLAGPLETTARSMRTTPFVVLLTVYRLVLWKLTGSADFLVGTPLSGRTRSETQEMLGYFLNMVVLRGAVDADRSPAELIAREHASTVAAYAHQDLPFEHLVAHLRPARQAGSTPLVQAMFSVDGQPVTATDYLGLRAEQLSLPGGYAQYDLMVKVIRDGDGLTARWDYDDAITDRATVERWAADYWALLAEVLTDPQRPVRQIGLLREVPATPRDTPSQPLVEVLAWSGATSRVEPAGFLQEAVAELWRELLGTSPGAEDVIFDLGGHSLTIAQLSFRLSETFGVAVAAPDLFENQTVAAQARMLETLLLGGAATLSDADLDQILEAG
ncbi:condensation domain-containing protein [Paractinoplanes hotanensis]|uniref:Condensation domain-containing protein n=1 Tax=Paractinoplanes hotanensis TaxID=2906497 RepID=A0ABT0YAM2_9ACTN|nr:condensation domain-containing protein [Actinoplanes hotanensis]MCM4083093.1 condensation domain-containing protein [Actinoplanes hotanensis]